MSNKNSRKRAADSVYPGDPVVKALGLDPAVWSVAVGYGKGILSGSRYAQVSICHLPSGREKSASFYGTGKAASRREVIEVAKRLVQELQRG